MICRLIFLALCISVLPATAQQQVPTESQVLGGIISQQSQENARLIVEMAKMQQALARETARANAAEAKVPKVDDLAK